MPDLRAAGHAVGATRPPASRAYLNFGGGTPFIKLQTQEPGKSIIQGQLGGYPPWTGYLMFLQLARNMTGHGAPGYGPEPGRRPETGW